MIKVSPKLPLVLSGVICIFLFLIFGAGSIGDSDVWWQMAYGRYFLENRTLILDHSIFSWTPADNLTIYCAWIAQLILYFIYSLFDIPGLFVFRYLVYGIPLFLLYRYIRLVNSDLLPMLWPVFLLYFLVSHVSGALIKPEIFSLVLMAVLVATYYFIKTDPDKNFRYWYVFPALILVWVNTHGGFIIGLVFLGSVGIGEILNYVFNSQHKCNLKTIKHILIAGVLTGICIFITPYGIDLPLHFVQNSSNLSSEDFDTILAYKDIFYVNLRGLKLPFYLCLMALLVFPLMLWLVRQKNWDLPTLIVSGVFIYFYMRHVRMSYFYATIFSFSIFYLLSQSNLSYLFKKKLWQRYAGYISLALVLLIGGHKLFATPYQYLDWNNMFQVKTITPIDEAEYLAELNKPKICNDYVSGGYFLWKLWPETKVMIDPRYFPYKSWYDKWVAFLASRDLDKTISEFDCDVWFLRHYHKHQINHFSSLEDWNLLYVGLSGVVFSRTENHDTQIHESVFESKVDNVTIVILDTLLKNNLYELTEPFKNRSPENDKMNQYLKHWIDGHQSFSNKDYNETIRNLRAAHELSIYQAHIPELLGALQVQARDYWAAGNYDAAVEFSIYAFNLYQYDALSVYNLGMMFRDIELDPGINFKHPGAKEWRLYLQLFLDITNDNQGDIVKDLRDSATDALTGAEPGDRFTPLTQETFERQTH